VTPVHPPGSLPASLEDTLRELIAEAMAEHAALTDADELHDVATLVQRYLPADEQVLEQLFRGRPEAGDLLDFGLFVHLPLVRLTTPAMFPVLTFAYDWPRHVLRLRVALFYRSSEDASLGQLRAFGMRFETPECWAGDWQPSEDPEDVAGHHDMFHAQPIRDLRKGDSTSALPGLGWLNPTQPSIPVSATDASGLLLALLVSVYGRKGVRERYQQQKLRSLKAAAVQVSGLPNPPGRP